MPSLSSPLADTTRAVLAQQPQAPQASADPYTAKINDLQTQISQSKPRLWERLLGAATGFATAYGSHNPELGLEIGSGVTNRDRTALQRQLAPLQEQEQAYQTKSQRDFENKRQSYEDALKSTDEQRRQQDSDALTKQREANANRYESMTPQDRAARVPEVENMLGIKMTPDEKVNFISGSKMPARGEKAEKEPTNEFEAWNAAFARDNGRKPTAKEIMQHSIDLKKAERNPPRGNTLSARDNLRLNAAARRLGKNVEDMTDDEINGALSMRGSNPAHTKDRQTFEDHWGKRFQGEAEKPYNAARNAILKQYGVDKDPKQFQAHADEITQALAPYEAQREQTKAKLQTEKDAEAEQYGVYSQSAPSKQPPTQSQPGAQNASKDFGPAPKGSKEGRTGKLPDGTAVVVRNGRIVRQK